MKLDDFESVFRSAVKTRFHLEPPVIETVLVISDLDESLAKRFLGEAKRFLGLECELKHDVEWLTLNADETMEVTDVLDRVRRNPPHLIVCYRHILGNGAKLPYSLGSTVDSLTQATDVPILLMPRPSDETYTLPKSTDRVMVVTDHLTGDDQLVNWAALFCNDDGTLFLTHIEDERVLAKYLEVISKIPGIDINVATEKVPKKLLDMPLDYVQSTAEELASNNIHEKVVPIVNLGNPVTAYEALVEEYEIDLLVMNTKDSGQSAMHSLAYVLSVEIRDRPLLLL